MEHSEVMACLVNKVYGKKTVPTLLCKKCCKRTAERMKLLNQYILLLFINPLLPIVFEFNNVCAVRNTEQSILTAPLQLQLNLL